LKVTLGKLLGKNATLISKKSANAGLEYIAVFEFNDNEVASFIANVRRFDEKPDLRLVVDLVIKNAINIETHSSGEIMLKAQTLMQDEAILIDEHLGYIQVFNVFDYFISAKKIITGLEEIVDGS